MKKIKEAGCPAWMMTFGDTISLLATFFVMLIAFANFEDEKLVELFGALKGALGVTPMATAPDPREVKEFAYYEHIRGLAAEAIEKRWLTVDQLSAIIPEARMALKKFGRPGVGEDKYVTVSMLEEGVVFIIYVKPLFKPGAAELLPGNGEMLQEIGAFIKALANEIQIIGVVNQNMEIRSPTADTPRGVGIERALAIANALVKECDFSRSRFGIGARVERVRPSTPDEASASLGRNLRAAPTGLRMMEAKRQKTGEERMEIIIAGRKIFKELSPEEVVVRGKW